MPDITTSMAQTYDGGREKAPQPLCRKVIYAKNNENKIEVWGDGNQTRSFLYIDDCIEGTRLFESDYSEPVNIEVMNRFDKPND